MQRARVTKNSRLLRCVYTYTFTDACSTLCCFLEELTLFEVNKASFSIAKKQSNAVNACVNGKCRNLSLLCEEMMKYFTCSRIDFAFVAIE